MAQFPKSTLQDLYKSFFQDRFGPGHIIADEASAMRYLQYELATMDNPVGPLLEDHNINICIYNQRFCDTYDIEVGAKVTIKKK